LLLLFCHDIITIDAYNPSCVIGLKTQLKYEGRPVLLVFFHKVRKTICLCKCLFSSFLPILSILDLLSFIGMLYSLFAADVMMPFLLRLLFVMFHLGRYINLIFFIFRIPLCRALVDVLSSNTFILMVLIYMRNSSFFVGSLLIGICYISFGFNFRLFLDSWSSSFGGFVLGSSLVTVRVFVLNVAVFVFLRLCLSSNVISLVGIRKLPFLY